jgi:hypothetical protein
VRRQAPRPLELRGGLQDPRCLAWLVHACIVVSLAVGVRPGEARLNGWEEDAIGARRRKASRARQGCSAHSCL